VLQGDVELVPRGALWAFKDEALEQRSAAEKHLLRMGPENMQRVQVKLHELRGALGLSVSATSRGEPATPPPGPRP
jgi:Protein of unknown function (DUF3014)